MIYSLGEKTIKTEGDDYYVADNAAVIGDVTLKAGASVWFGTTVRGDNDPIVIGEGTNVQDGCVLHADPGFPLTLGNQVSIGHMVMLHGCTIGDGSLVGIGSIILNGATIGKNCLIGANSMITEGKNIPDNSVVMGSPGKIIRQTTDSDLAMIARPAPHYQARFAQYKQHLKPQS
ncbi:MAG: gamma carbonic anhydrase family protein [Rhodospirillales bacterium]|nr:gamma carbonic anhydrase family protein [Rhodospirillales bacterium]